MTKYTHSTVDQAIMLLGRPVYHQVMFEVASVCTGSASDAVACDAQKEAFENEGIGCKFELSFLCELNKR